MCVCVGFCDLVRTISGINNDLVRTTSPLGTRRLVLMRQNIVSDFLDSFERLGLGRNWLRLGLHKPVCGCVIGVSLGRQQGSKDYHHSP